MLHGSKIRLRLLIVYSMWRVHKGRGKCLLLCAVTAVIIKDLYICRASARLPASQSTVPHFPSSLDGMRNQKA